MKKQTKISRRTFVKTSSAAAGGAYLLSSLSTQADFIKAKGGEVQLNWLGDAKPIHNQGLTWGVSWPKGKIKRNSGFELIADDNQEVPIQSWPLAFWPDGTLKWTGHAVPAIPLLADNFTLKPTTRVKKLEGIKIEDSESLITIDTGGVIYKLPKSGNQIISSILKAGKTMASNGRLILLHQDAADEDSASAIQRSIFQGEISKVTLEQNAALRSVVKIEGSHQSEAGRAIVNFVVRLYFYHKADAFKMIHTIVFEGDEKQDFIKGLGVRFDLPMHDELHDRHVRFAGEEEGIFAEAVRGLTGLRRDPGRAVIEAQLAGRKTPPIEMFPENVSRNIHYIPAFGDYTLFQGDSDSFSIRKRTAEGHSWLNAGKGKRARGLALAGGPSGSFGFGIRNFWQSYPGQLDIKNAHLDQSEVTAWLWAPNSPTMDLRFYHDGMGQDTYPKQLDALDITYEDYEPGFGTAKGVGRTSELNFWVLDATPSHEELNEMMQYLTEPPLLTASPDYMLQVGVFGGLWYTDRLQSDRAEAFDKQLLWYFEFYQKQVEEHRWFGFWDFGDFMHTYDRDRHVWRYDVGGFAWDNSELSTDLWLWYYYLRTGQKEVFRLAEAMTRHTGEVDVHHSGPFAPLGSRHNVMHWGCSAKQLRISTAANRRFYYYLTADERTGDLMREQVNAAESLLKVVPIRKVAPKDTWGTDDPNQVYLGFGTDWGAIAAAWLTEWERTEDKSIRDKLLASMRSIGNQPKGFFSMGSRMNLKTGEFEISKSQKASASHLSAVFGLTEIAIELYELLGMETFNKAWLQYCQYYNASPEEQEKVLGNSLGKLNLAQGHARLTAFAAREKADTRLAKRAWEEFYEGSGGIKSHGQAKFISGNKVLTPRTEAEGVSTNATAQWGLAAMHCLALLERK
ncbi:Tat pathway signal sequence domain protein [Belliella sp. DSM 111904]|uniref:Tat pathway signal sequence domain protein n=1 Tax=Belliella filtrata TaxID=2923435 RepID=A0ABS9UYU8_9BACT|nr:Tat pathway signal sequence domain protein [Belliella filtrata]MCH7409346.1 Tat pathway signal sequence domain protein [Belliella filtrata]